MKTLISTIYLVYLLKLTATDAASSFAVCVVTSNALVSFNRDVKLNDFASGKHVVSKDCTGSEFTVTKTGNTVEIDHNDYDYQVSPSGVKVDGKPAVIPEGGHITAGTVEIYREPNNAYRLKFHRGGALVYKEGKIILNVNPHFKNRLCGICGNFGDNASLVRSIVKFD